MNRKPRVYLTSNVFFEMSKNEKISDPVRNNINKLWQKLTGVSELRYFNGRFPSDVQIKENIRKYDSEILGCHLSHPISSDLLKSSNIFAVATATAGYNHIQKTEKDDVLITHTPGVLHETVADYTIALIMANLRNLVDLHNYVWDGKWTTDEKWDLDQNLSSVINSKVLGIVGMGEIGREIVKKLHNWGIKILYYDIKQMVDFEKDYPYIEFRSDLRDIFKEADIVSLHLPLNKSTEKIVGRELLFSMKKNALLVNTARGPIIDLEAMLGLLEKKEIQIDLCFDVYPIEPIDPKILARLKKIKREQPNRRIVLIPHNASADADTRGKMVIMFLEDIIKIVESSKIEDLKDVHMIPEQKPNLTTKNWKIYNHWNN